MFFQLKGLWRFAIYQFCTSPQKILSLNKATNSLPLRGCVEAHSRLLRLFFQHTWNVSTRYRPLLFILINDVRPYSRSKLEAAFFCFWICSSYFFLFFAYLYYYSLSILNNNYLYYILSHLTWSRVSVVSLALSGNSRGESQTSK